MNTAMAGRSILRDVAWLTVALGLMTEVAVRSAPALAQSGESVACRQWFDRVFASTDQAAMPAHLKLVFEDVPDTPTRGRSWRGTPYRLGDKTYSHGIAFNSTKHILVRLGKPAERFVAEVGLENNDDTQRGATLGNGSVTFHVLVDGKEVFTSPVRRLKDGALPLDVPLRAAQEFEIRVKDGGDGRGWDQALWAEAVVTLQDGTTLRLQDMPWAESVGDNPYGFSFLYDGRPSASSLKDWRRQTREQSLDAQRTRREVRTATQPPGWRSAPRRSSSATSPPWNGWCL
jgi:hypothetical protein